MPQTCSTFCAVTRGVFKDIREMFHFSAPSLNLCPLIQASTSSNIDDFLPRRTPKNNSPHLYLSKPSWVVQTESNVRKWGRKKPDPSCVVCSGSGRVDCHHCQGKGRSNYVDRTMLPEGKWPIWCKMCGGSGLEYCSRCLGTGEYRDIMGFHFMKAEPSRNGDSRKHGRLENHDKLTAADMLLLQPPESGHELA